MIFNLPFDQEVSILTRTSGTHSNEKNAIINSYLTSPVLLYAACRRNSILKSDDVQGLGREERCLTMLLQ